MSNNPSINQQRLWAAQFQVDWAETKLQGLRVLQSGEESLDILETIQQAIVGLQENLEATIPYVFMGRSGAREVIDEMNKLFNRLARVITRTPDPPDSE